METTSDLEVPKFPVNSLFKDRFRITSARLKNYDYANAGLYFVTVNAKNNRCVFGEVRGTGFHPSPLGVLVNKCWEQIPQHYPHIDLDVFQLMPNHFHGILWFKEDGEGAGELSEAGRKAGALQKGSLSIVLNSFKGAVTRAARASGLGGQIWQSRFHDHIIRTERALQEIREYIINNPAKWADDRYFAK